MEAVMRRLHTTYYAGLFCAAAIAGAIWSTQAAAQGPAAGVTVFHGARLVLGTDQAPIENGAFIVNGDRITWVGVLADAKIPPNAVRVDLTGKTVIPAIIDTH